MRGLRTATGRLLRTRHVHRALRAASLVVTDRRWAATLSALALGFGLFIGVAVGPGTAGSLATGAAQIIEIPGGGGGEPAEASAAPEAGGEEAPAFEPAAEPEEAFESSAAFEPAAEPEASRPRAKQAAPAPEREAGEEEKAEAPRASGIVVHVNPAAASYAIAEDGGVLTAVHAAKLPQPGTRISVETRPLANGTAAEQGDPTTKGAREDRATVAGVVSYVSPDPALPAYTLSTRGVSLLIRVRPDPAGAAAELPALGASAKVTVDIEPVEPDAGTSRAEVPAIAADSGSGCGSEATAGPSPQATLWQRSIKVDGAPFTYTDLEGMVEAVCPASGQMLISADDLREAGADLTLTLPASIDASGLTVGDSVAATAEIGADGGLELSGLASDERAKGADDGGSLQGDLKR
jgi:hypothetical protein